MPTTPLIPKARTSGICAMDWYYDGDVPVGVADARGWDSLRQAQVKGGSRTSYWNGRHYLGEEEESASDGGVLLEMPDEVQSNDKNDAWDELPVVA